MKPAFLGELDCGRENNFNLIRMIAAAAVLVSHAWPLTLGQGAPEPLQALTGFSLGGSAVTVFFAISGYLITRSFERQPTVGRWLRARVLRLMPALAVVLVLSVAVLGALVTTLPWEVYLTDPETLSYVPRNLSLALPQYPLPGVFENNPSQAVNGSLWTLFFEVACYGGVLVLGLLGILRHRRWMVATLVLFALAHACISLTPLREAAPFKVLRLSDLGLPFVIGMAFYLWRERLPLHPGLLLGLALVTVLARDAALYPVLFTFSLAYAVFLLAYLPRGRILHYNRLGDYSYGTYIYAFPVQQLMVHAAGTATPWTNIALSLPLTLALAVLSWVWIERPALALVRGSARRAPIPVPAS